MNFKYNYHGTYNNKIDFFYNLKKNCVYFQLINKKLLK